MVLLVGYGNMWAISSKFYTHAMQILKSLQVGNYIQTLWAEEQPTDADNYNGFVEAANTMICKYLWKKIIYHGSSKRDT